MTTCQLQPVEFEVAEPRTRLSRLIMHRLFPYRLRDLKKIDVETAH